LPRPQRYVGFGRRFIATLVDTFWLALVTVPLLVLFYGWEYFAPGSENGAGGVADILISYVLPIAVVLTFWVVKQATPGKMVVHSRIVDASHGGTPSKGQFIIRYLGYYVSLIPLGLGFLWILWDPRRQGWHDKIANTVVIDTRAEGVPPPLPG
jgi:uncharacterized RDD family membrane protein YckC